MTIPAIIEFENKKKTKVEKDINFRDKKIPFFFLRSVNFNDNNLINLIRPIDASIEIGIIQ